jgi:Holliday junction resolvasome RuvABC endonuclease subunit
VKIGRVRLLALDQSLVNTGYVVLEGDRVLEWGVAKTSPQQPLGSRLAAIWDQVMDVYLRWGCTMLAIESAAHGAPSKDNRPAMVTGTIIYEAWRHRWIVTEANLSTVKKWFTGNGRAGKELMKETACAAGFEGWQNEHAADAYAIGRWLLEAA